MSDGPENRTDSGNARRLVRRYGHRIRFVHPWGVWLVFRDGRWMRDETAEIMRLAADTVVGIYGEALATEDDRERRELALWAAKSESSERRAAIEKLARAEPGIPVLPSALDADPWLLNVLNGTLDLRTGTLRPHDLADLITKMAPVLYDPAASCPTWIAFLARAFDSRADLIDFVQVAIGYSLTGRVTEQVLFFLYGLGANGKSVFLTVLLRLLGDYAAQIEARTLLRRRGDGPREDIARLEGRRLVAGVEVRESHPFDEATLKALTGGDRIVARALYRGTSEFEPQFKLWLAANHKPPIDDTTESTWRRLRIVPFTVTIPPEERDPQLIEKLSVELPGILRWAIDGCLLWQQRGLPMPDDVAEATATYRAEMDVFAGFLETCCALSPTASSGATVLYQGYKRWAEQAGERVESQRKFGERLRERGFQRVRRNTGMVWRGLEMADAVNSEPLPPHSGNSALVSLVKESYPKRVLDTTQCTTNYAKAVNE